MLSSSPRPDRLYKRNANQFQGQVLVGPSSPSAAYQDGEISPSFDASFASSMSITSDDRNQPSPLGTGPSASASAPTVLLVDGSSPIMAMDISPAPAPLPQTHPISVRPLVLFGRPASQPQTLTLSSTSSKPERPFLRNLFRGEQSAPPTQTTFPPIAPLSIPRSTSPDAFAAPLSSTSSSMRPKKPRSRPSSGTGGHARRPSLTHLAASQPILPTAEFTYGSKKASGGPRDENVAPGVDSFFGTAPKMEENLVPSRYPAPSRPRSALPSAWNSSSTSLAPPNPPIKRKSDSSVPKSRKEIEEGSPFRMEIDGASPRNGPSPLSPRRSVSDSAAPLAYGSPASNDSPSSQDGAAEELGSFFEDNDGTSPLPANRKRFLAQENSPTPASPTPVCNLSSTSLGRLSKVSTFGGPGHVARRQRSSLGLNHLSRRPSLASFGNVSGSSASILSDSGSTCSSSNSSFNKRLATQAQDGRPSHSRRNSRRTLSVADAVSAAEVQHSPALFGGGIFERDLNIPMESPRPAPIPLDGPDYFTGKGTGIESGKGNGKRLGTSIDLGPAVMACMSPDRQSPIAGFRGQEIKGKALPCFKHKDDGLMRITPETLNLLQNGHFSDKQIASYHIIDCRFEFEYSGGHIENAVHLPSIAHVEDSLLRQTDSLPVPSTSEQPLAEGKTILIFHCEFSATRAPTSASHLRKQDRRINLSQYPKVHYPEVYILQGGYKAYWEAYPERCTGGYVTMDDKKHKVERAFHLENFRKQKGVFMRASSFTFGEAQHMSALLRNAEGGSRRPTSCSIKEPIKPVGFEFPKRGSTISTPSGAKRGMLSVHDEDGEGDSSFGTNGSSPCGSGGSPCPPTSKGVGRPALKIPSQPFPLAGKTLNPKRLMNRAQTSASLPFAR
ncbi:hypothetical protein JCM3765_001457 [Sporobolomyces pararoseus]